MRTVSTFCANRVAEITGLPTWRLIEIEPAGFGCPRDRVRSGGADHYTVGGLWRLVTILRTAGEEIAADRLQVELEQTAPEPTACRTNWWQQGALA